MYATVVLAVLKIYHQIDKTTLVTGWMHGDMLIEVGLRCVS